jgi:acyl-CoA synthetase (AMP-forming)/AMP-acid ligase II
LYLDLKVGNLVDPLQGKAWTPDAIRRRLRQRAALFARHGLRPGDRVLLNYGNRPEFFIDLLAIWRLGACAMPLDARASSAEIDNVCRIARPRLSLWHESPPANLTANAAELGLALLDTTAGEDDRRLPDDYCALDAEALILFTSGTTGQPKGVVHTHRTLRARWLALRDNLGTTAFERTLCLLPTHFGHGLICNSLYPWLSGQDLYILPPFRTDLILSLGALLDEHRITFMSSVPPIWRLALKLAQSPRERSLRRVFCGSAPLSAHLWEGIRSWTGAPEVSNTYGITETGSWIAGTTLPCLQPEDGLIGSGWGTVIRILSSGDASTAVTEAEICAPGQEGFVWLNTPGLMRGYLDRDDLTRSVVNAGWFSTGDIGVLDEHGRLYLRGRQREEINRGGMKVHPADVDAVIERCPGVLDVCTFAYAHEFYGEDVGVAVVLQPGQDDAFERVRAWANRELGEHRAPGRWHVLAEIPRTSRGKINRRDVATACAQAAGADIGRPPGLPA